MEIIASVLDLAVTSVTPTPSIVQEGSPIAVDVVVENLGNVDSGSFDVSLNDTTDGILIGTSQNVPNLAPGANVTLTFAWDTTGASIGFHNLEGSHGLADDNAANDSMTATVTIEPLILDLAINSVVPSPSIADEGDPITVEVTVENIGDLSSGSFDISLGDTTDGVSVGSAQNIPDLASGASTTLIFAWDTTGASIGSHTLVGSHNLLDSDSANDTAQAIATINIAPSFFVSEDWDAPDGSSWSTQWSFDNANQAQFIDISNNHGRVGRESNSPGNDIVIAYINTNNAEDVDASVTFSINSNAMSFGMVSRRSDADSDTYYYSKVDSNKGGVSIYKVVNGVDTKLGQITNPNITSGTDWNMRFVTSTNGAVTDLSVKVWLAGSSEPASFQLELTDGEPSLQNASGRFGLRYKMFRNRVAQTDDYQAQ